jgi:hypothetical protein
VFFGALTTNAAAGSQAIAPALRSELVAAQVAPAQADQIVASVQSCVTARASEKDSSVVPTECLSGTEAQASPAVASAVAKAGQEANAQMFWRTFRDTLWVYVALIALCFLLMFNIPATARERAEWG